MSVFVDSSALVALYYPTDAHAKAAKRISKNLAKRKDPLFTINYVTAEALTVVSQRAGRKQAISLGEDLFGGDIMSIVYVDEYLEALAFDRFTSIPQKDVSFVDCACFEFCQKIGIRDVFTFDKHFAKQGFKLIKP